MKKLILDSINKYIKIGIGIFYILKLFSKYPGWGETKLTDLFETWLES